jgi:hypothetical protein
MRRGTTTQCAVSVLVAVGFVAGLTGGLAGCTNDPEPAHLPTPTKAVTPSPTPTPTPTPDAASVPPERPSAMDVADSAGAEAAAVYFLQLFPYVFATGDLEDYRALSHPECIYCASVTAGVEAMFAANQQSVGGMNTITAVTSVEVEPGRWWSIDVEVTQSPSQTLDANGQVVEEFPDTVGYHMDIAVIFEANRWVVRELTPTETSRDGT